ncbi:MAG: sigma-70 family RNA polymerase sigma factor [Planctomycetota bacterium]
MASQVLNEPPIEQTSHLEELSVILKNTQLGDATAESTLHRKFVGRLIRLASRRINDRFRAKIEPEEIVQSVFASFFRRHTKGEFHFDSWNDLWALLVKITLCKCANKVEGFMSAKRNINREVAGKVSNSRDSSINAIAAEPTPQEISIFNELLDQLLDQLNSLQQQVVVLRLQGFSNLEISEKIGRSERTVYRTLNDVRSIFVLLDSSSE